MANTRQSTKRAAQADARTERNQMTRNQTRSAVRALMAALQKKDTAAVKTTYAAAVRALSKAASKGAVPKTRAARKVSRLTLLVKRTLPKALAAQA